MDHDGHIALTDFGLSKEGVEDVYEMQLSTFCGTAEYIAPELLKGLKYGATVDWWSLGVLLYEMMASKRPSTTRTASSCFTTSSTMSLNGHLTSQHLPLVSLEASWPKHRSGG